MTANLNITTSTMNTRLIEIQSAINTLQSKENTHDEVILLLKRVNSAYEYAFQSFHIAAQEILHTEPGTENKFNEMKGELLDKFQSVSQIWKKHKSSRTFSEGAKASLQDNQVKKAFKSNLARLEKTAAASKPLRKTHSYSNHSSRISSTSNFFNYMSIFLLGALLF